MKGLVAIFGLLMAVIVVITFVIVELLVKLAPLLVAATCIWGAVKVMRAHRARRAADQDRLRRRWGQPVGELPELTPTAPVPPVIAHRERACVVRGDDTGLLSNRDDGYVRVSAQPVPRVERLSASHQQRRPMVPRRTAARRSERRRP
jgi:hypothetical protein